MRILIADDEKSIGITLRDELQEAGYEVFLARDGHEADELMKKHDFDVAVLDIRMPGCTGLDLLKKWQSEGEKTFIILMTAFGSIEDAVSSVKSGAYDFITKPFMNEQILSKLKQLEFTLKLTQENKQLKEELHQKENFFVEMVGHSKPMQKVFDILRTIHQSPLNSNVLIQGESGTGKEITARNLYYHSLRKQGPFITLSCATLPENLLEDALFGHEKGAFTDARDTRIGKFEQAHTGTIFLDDIDDMSLHTQVKLLRVLQEREIERLGGTKTIKVDVRVLTATKIDLEKAVQEKKFREDLYYRLHVVKIILPPLSERKEDIPYLLQHFIKKHGMGKPFTIAPKTLEEMCHFPWKGNIRELEASIERAIIMSGGQLELKREYLLLKSTTTPISSPSNPLRPLKEVIGEAEKLHIKRVLEWTQDHKAKAAELLGISRKNLWEKMKEYDL
ncbi:MAG: sigma-54 dependent transcriptional regulator [Planctomycetota bacterium]